MKIPEIKEQEGLVNYAEKMSQLYYKSYNTETRKLKGQFFTPKQISNFMASLFKINNTCIRLLDAGAGTGILTAAFCDQLLKSDIKVRLTIDVYENDPNILPFLKMTLKSCKIELENNLLV